MRIHPVDILCIGIKLIVRDLIANVNADENETRQADSEPGNIDDRINFVLEEIAKSDLQVIAKHGGWAFIKNII
jgi:hypothetical protein